MLAIFLILVLIVISTFLLTQKFNLPRNVSLLFLLQPLVMCSAPIIVFIGGLLSTQLTNNASFATLPISLMILGVATGSIPAAMIAKAKGRKFAILTGFSCLLIAALLAITATKLALFNCFVLASFLFGIGGAFTQQLRFVAIESTKNEEDTPKVLAILMLSGVFAAFLGPEVAVSAKDWLDSPHGYAGSFALLAAFIGLAALIMVFFEEPQIKEVKNSGDARPLSVIVKQPIFLIAICTATIGYALMSFIMTATPVHMHVHEAYSLQETKWVIQSHILAMFLPSLFSGHLANKLGIKPLMFLGLVLYAACIGLSLSGRDVMHYWGGLVLLGLGWNFLFVSGTLLLASTYQENERFKAQGFHDFFVFGSQACASLSSGAIIYSLGWDVLVLLALPFVILQVLVMIFGFKGSAIH